MDGRRLLDALVGAVSRSGAPGGQGKSVLDQILGQLGSPVQSAGQQAGAVLNQATGGLRDAAGRLNEATGIGPKVDQTTRDLTGGQSPGDLAHKAKDFMNRNPGLAEAALLGVAGVLFGSRKSRGVAVDAAKLGGLALIGGLAYTAYQNYRSGKPLLNQPEGGGQPGGVGQPRLGRDAGFGGSGGGAATAGGMIGGHSPRSVSSVPGVVLTSTAAPQSDEVTVSAPTSSDEDALVLVRAMLAAAVADGHLDEGERSRIVAGLSQAGIDAEATRWVERELADPATVDDLADKVSTPEFGAQVYAAARVAIEPDTLQEREFLRGLARALDLDATLVGHIDEAAASLKVSG
jgi:uncharacterized membrane protein YebE (DUF533 family)